MSFNVSASLLGVAQQAALVSALASALGCAPDAIAVSGVSGNASAASVGVVLSAPSGAAAEVLTASLDALVSVTAPSGLAGAIAASDAALSGLAWIDAGGAAAVSQGGPGATLRVTLELLGPGLSLPRSTLRRRLRSALAWLLSWA